MEISDIQPKNISESKSHSVKDKIRDEKLWKASKDMEGVFLSQLIKAMEKTIPKSGLTGSNNNLAKMMFSSVLGKEIANKGGIGLAKHIYEGLKNDNSKTLNKLQSEYPPDILYNLKLPEDVDE